MSKKLLQDKVIFLTGGSAGIGFACAQAYKEEGALVAIVANNKTELEEAVAKLGAEHLGVFCDVSKDADVKGAVEEVLNRYGRIDAVHNNAGIAHPSKAIHETTEEEWHTLMDTNLKSVYLTTKYCFEELKKARGAILNTSSLVGEIGQALHAAYAATKGAMNALTKSMALDYAPHGIRVNAVAPAGVWTPMLRQWNKEQPDSVSMETYLDAIHPLGYCPEADVVADVCTFLLSEKARFVTGCIMPVSGGAELGYRK